MGNPTTQAYSSLTTAYDVFNRELFAGQLPACLITMQRRKGIYGYFAGGRFVNTSDSEDVTDELALNPLHFANRTTEQTLSTLVHEMCHVWQHHFGDPPRRGYHDKQWAAKMQEVGLLPTDTGQPGGKMTGQKVTHLVIPDGPFVQACAQLLATYPTALYHDRTAESEAGKQARQKKSASKTKYTCSGCGLSAWAKPDVNLCCGDCEQPMEAVS